MTRTHSIKADGRVIHQGLDPEVARSIFLEAVENTEYTDVSYHVHRFTASASREERLIRVREHLESWAKWLEEENNRLRKRGTNGHKPICESSE